MKFTIDWMEVKTAASGSKYAKCTVTNEAGEKKENVAIFASFPGFDGIMTGHTIEAEMTEKDYNGSKSYSLNPPKSTGGAPRANMDRVMEKKANLIGEAQARKEQSIHAAQDRSAWMWAKTNASTLLAGRIGVSENLDHIAGKVLELATKIYNGEPTEPFS